MTYFFGILKSEDEEHHEYWVKACEKFKMKYKVIEFTKNDWVEECLDPKIDCFLVSGAYDSILFKKLYDERLYVLSQVHKAKIYPTFDEVLLHENKKFLSYWLRINKVPHPRTDVFYYEKEALEFLKKSKLPVVGKTCIGDSGKGIAILKTYSQAEKYVKKAFSSGIRKQFGPNMNQGDLAGRFKKNIVSYDKFKKKLKKYIQRFKDSQYGYVILQEYIPHDYEWRMVKVGDSFFGHKKMRDGEMASGTKLKGFGTPPDSILNFVKEICEKYGFLSQAVDIFENPEGGYFVNELQTFFGQVYPYQMLVDDKMGRMRYVDSKWIFEEGDFNTNLTFDLRMEEVIRLLDEGKL